MTIRFQFLSRVGLGATTLLLIFINSCKSLEPSCDSTITFANKSPETLEIQVNGAVPSGCGYVGPGDQCSSVVSADVTFTYSAKGSKGTKWAGSDAIPKCTNKTTSLTY